MRLLDQESIENIATGAAFFGAGGGGNPFLGKLMALEAINKNGPVKLLDVSEIRDDDYFCPAAIMGAPAVMMEKIPKGDEFERVFKMLSQYTGHQFVGTFPMEAGGVNSMVPIALRRLWGFRCGLRRHGARVSGIADGDVLSWRRGGDANGHYR